MKMRVLYGKFGVPKARYEIIWSKEKSSNHLKSFRDKDDSPIYLSISPEPINN
jgi:hypothetical protein